MGSCVSNDPTGKHPGDPSQRWFWGQDPNGLEMTSNSGRYQESGRALLTGSGVEREAVMTCGGRGDRPLEAKRTLLMLRPPVQLT